jgi:phytoene desaturase (3,4-didehydrolycopene-forming)
MTSTDHKATLLSRSEIILYFYTIQTTMTEKQRKKAIVVGAGVGGTATAARLAHAGLDVEVYEKNEFSGGRCSLIHHDGYRFDQVGSRLPSSLLYPFRLFILSLHSAIPISVTTFSRANPQGPSLFLLPPLFHQLYTDLGTTLAEHVELLQCHPNYVIHYHDGEKVTLSSDRAQLREEVEKWEGPGGGDQLDAFLAYVSLILGMV